MINHQKTVVENFDDCNRLLSSLLMSLESKNQEIITINIEIRQNSAKLSPSVP